MSFEIQGFDKLQKQLSEASKAFEELDGEIAMLRFDPDDQSSVEAAIADMERAIDGKVAPYRNNPLVASAVEQMKAKYRERILERAAEARLPTLSVLYSLFRQVTPAWVGRAELASRW